MLAAGPGQGTAACEMQELPSISTSTEHDFLVRIRQRATVLASSRPLSVAARARFAPLVIRRYRGRRR